MQYGELENSVMIFWDLSSGRMVKAEQSVSLRDRNETQGQR